MRDTIFGDMARRAQKRLEAAGLAPARIPPGFAAREGRAGARAESIRLRRPGVADLRGCHVASPKAEVLNLMGYPAQADRVPVFAMEYVAFGGVPRIAVVDLQAAAGPGPLQERASASIEPLRARFEGRLTPGGELPEWAGAHFTPGCVYARPADASELPALGEALEAYLERWCVQWLPHAGGAASGVEAIAAYQAHHIEHTPGRPFLRSVFGEHWAESYIADFMYPASAAAAGADEGHRQLEGSAS